MAGYFVWPSIRLRALELCRSRSAAWFASNRSGQKFLSRNAFISVMRATGLWNCDNLSNAQRISRERALLAEAQVGSRFVVVAEI
jgi:hypothetical protein